MMKEKNYWFRRYILALLMGLSFIVYTLIRPICLRNGLTLGTADFIREIYSSIFMIICALIMFFISPGPHDTENSKIYGIIWSIFLFISGIFTFISALKLF